MKRIELNTRQRLLKMTEVTQVADIASSSDKKIKIIVKPSVSKDEKPDVKVVVKESSEKDTKTNVKSEKKIIIKISKTKDEKTDIKRDVIWKSLDFMGFSKYEASDHGDIKNIETKRILTGGNIGGYINYGINDDNGKRKYMQGHRLVAMAFIPNPENKLTVDHINWIRSDNRVINLRWATSAEQDKHKIGPKTKSGRVVYQLDDKQNIIKEWKKIIDAADEFKINRSLISRACKKKTKRCDFYWAYADEYNGDIIGEEWADVAYMDGKISSMGRFKYNTNGYITYGNLNKGYFIINKTMGGDNTIVKMAHVLVAEAFLGKYKGDGLVVNHKDSNRQNNKLENLEVVTQSENMLHAHRNNRVPKINKLSKPVCQFDLKGKFVAEYKSLTEASEKSRVPKSSIGNVCSIDGKTAGGFIWKFK